MPQTAAYTQNSMTNSQIRLQEEIQDRRQSKNATSNPYQANAKATTASGGNGNNLRKTGGAAENAELGSYGSR